MVLSKKAWEKSLDIVEAIKKHPFNKELIKGTLSKFRFSYYIEQDSLYLQDFARCLAVIASKIELKYVRIFLRFSEYAFRTEQDVVHKFYKRTFGFKETGLITNATLNYTSFLKSVCFNESSEVGVAAILPCFWVYKSVGAFISEKTNQDNPYSRWIDTYVSKEFSTSVDSVINIFDMLAKKADTKTQSKMLDVFYKSVCLEWHFWNDAYTQVAFDNI